MIRIISDLHWGHKASLIKDPSSLEALLAEPEIIIFNGDTLEEKFQHSPLHRSAPLPSLSDFRSFISGFKTQPIFITGNHDPKISPFHYGEINNSEILVTHGDGIFKDIAPWSQNARILEGALKKGLDSLMTDDRTTLYQFLEAVKVASLEEQALVKGYDPTVWGKLQIFARQAWPPNRVFKILDSWSKAPCLALKMMSYHQRVPRFLIIGHTHRPHIWDNGQTCVINTGSFFPWPGAYVVDIQSNGISVIKVIRSRQCFRLGKTLRKFNLDIDLGSLNFPVESTPEASNSLKIDALS